MYSEGLHIMFVELDKKTSQFLESTIIQGKFYSNFELELLNELSWILTEIIEQMEVEDSEHDGNKIDKNILEKYGYFL